MLSGQVFPPPSRDPPGTEAVPSLMPSEKVISNGSYVPVLQLPYSRGVSGLKVIVCPAGTVPPPANGTGPFALVFTMKLKVTSTSVGPLFVNVTHAQYNAWGPPEQHLWTVAHPKHRPESRQDGLAA